METGRRRFRVVFLAVSGVRLHDKPAEPASTWTFPWQIDGEDVQVLVRDRVDSSRGYPQHLGLEVQVELPASDLDQAFQRASSLASMHLELLSTIGRGPCGSPEHVLGYEITPGTEEREFRQVHGPLTFPIGKTPVPNPPFGDFFEAYVGLRDPSIRYPILMAVQFYAAALREVEPVLRFMLLWLACEAIEDSLRRKLDRKRKDRNWGLKALAEQQGDSADLIDDAYVLRNDIFHVRGGVDVGEIPVRAGSLADRLEPLVAPGVLVLLDLGGRTDQLPTQAATAHPVRLVFSATVRGEPQMWSADSHPHVEVDFNVELININKDGSINFKTPANFRLRNCEQMSPRSIEVRGPFGPNIGQMSLDQTSVIRGQDTTQDERSPRAE